MAIDHAGRDWAYQAQVACVLDDGHEVGFLYVEFYPDRKGSDVADSCEWLLRFCRPVVRSGEYEDSGLALSPGEYVDDDVEHPLQLPFNDGFEPAGEVLREFARGVFVLAGHEYEVEWLNERDREAILRHFFNAPEVLDARSHFRTGRIAHLPESSMPKTKMPKTNRWWRR